MELKVGMKLFSSIKNIEEKVSINQGVKRGIGFNIYKDVGYSNNSYVPINKWRNLSPVELSLLVTKEEGLSSSSNIGLYKLPQNLVVSFQELELNKCESRADVLNVFQANQEKCKKINTALEELLFSYGKLFNFYKIVVSRPNIETLTFYDNNKQFEYVGLHMDRSTQFDFSNVEESRNRVSINISKESRYLYIVNLTLNQILKKIVEKTSMSLTEISIHNIGELFFNYFPDYPVIRMLQEPYEFYIAPTDNFLHDGSTLDKKDIDITLVYLGYFDLYANV